MVDAIGMAPVPAPQPIRPSMTTRPARVADPKASPYVLPALRRGTGDFIVLPTRSGAGLERGARVARSLGGRFQAFADCQQQFLAEMRLRLQALDTAIAEDSRAQLKGAVRGALDVLDWCDVVQGDLQTESAWAASGFEPVDVNEIVQAVAAEAGTADNDVRVGGHLGRSWWGDAALLAEVVRQGLALVAERTGGLGSRRIEVGSVDGGAWVRIAGSGEPTDGPDGVAVQRFRQVVERLGARVVPDALGPGGAGLVLLLPGSPAGDP